MKIIDKKTAAGFLKYLIWFVLANSFVCIMLGVIYQDMEKALNIYTYMTIGTFIAIPLSVFLHWLTLKMEKVKENRQQSSEYWRCVVYFIVFVTYLITMLSLYNSVHYTVVFAISLVCLFIISITIGANVSIKMCSFGIIGKIINGFFMCSYEFSLSDKLKNNYAEKGKHHIGSVVKRMNHINLLFSCALAITYVCLSPNLLPLFNKNHLNGSILLFFFISLPLVARTVARSIEILSAFFIDTVGQKQKTTNLEPSERVILALYSLVEITFLFAAVYLFIDIMSYLPATAEIDRISFFFYSFGITTSTSISFEIISKTQCIAIVLQVITSMVLIVFTFSRYIGEINKV
ncbi:MAG: hypothetical protein RR769_05905 [Anaerovoracaceae bacterium]